MAHTELNLDERRIIEKTHSARMPVSDETIYAFVYSRAGQPAELTRYLPCRCKKRRPRGQVFPPERSIHQPPDSVKSRDVFGDWEDDLMIFERANGKLNVASLVERKTRVAVWFRNNDRRSGQFLNKLMGIIEPLPQLARRSITFDRGVGFREWRQLETCIGTASWFCDPQAP